MDIRSTPSFKDVHSIQGYSTYDVTAEHGSQSGPAYLYSNGGPGVPYALPNGIALYCTTDGNSYLVPAAQQQVCVKCHVMTSETC